MPSFETEVTGGSVTHGYDEIERKATLADTAKPVPKKVAAGDTVKVNLLNDLSATGYYAFAQTNELKEGTVVYTPNTAAGASWTGTVTVLLPEEVGADEWGAELESSVEFPVTGRLAFTNGTVVGSTAFGPGTFTITVPAVP